MTASLILILHLLGAVSAQDAAIFLFITGGLLILADLFVVSFGVLILNGIIALVVGYGLYTGTQAVYGIPVDWSLFFGVAAIELALVIALIWLYMRMRGRRATTGIEGIVGDSAEVIEWSGQQGRVRVQGQSWKARCEDDSDLKVGDTVIIIAHNKLVLTVKGE